MSKRNAIINFDAGRLIDHGDDAKTEWDDGIPIRKELPPGAASWTHWYSRPDEIAGLQFVCPCGCGAIGYVNVSGDKKPLWQWDGNKEKPTLSPSIQRTSGCRWHGYLRAGVFQEC